MELKNQNQINLLLTNQICGQVYAWGLGKEGQLGNAQQENQEIPVKSKISKDIIQVQAGGQFSACLNSNGDIFMFGSNKKGQLGLVTSKETDILIPQKINNLQKIKQISLGDWHSLALNQEGICFSTGYNKSGCLGIPSITSQNNQFQKIECNILISHIFAGRNISLFIEQDSQKLFSAGISYLCGNGNKQDQRELKIIQNLENEKINSICTGFSSCAAINNQGQVFTWGKNTDFNLGNGINSDTVQDTPKLIDFFEENKIKIQQISCSRGDKYVHMGAVDVNGHVYTWGSGYKGKLGHGKSANSKDEGGYDNVKVPKLIQYLVKENILVKKFIAGGIHSSVLTQDNKLLTFGCGSDGRLGHPEKGNAKYLYKEPLPKQIEYFKDKQVLDVFSSYYHMIALVQE